MNDDDVRDTITSSEWMAVSPQSVEIFDDRPTLRSPLPAPPPSTQRTWSTFLRDAASFFTALSDAVSNLERRRARARRR